MSITEFDPKVCDRCGRAPSTEDRPCPCDCDHPEYENSRCTACGIECEHEDIEGCYCLDCGEDQTEDMMARAYDYAKGMREGY